MLIQTSTYIIYNIFIVIVTFKIWYGTTMSEIASINSGVP